jgi:cell division septum initiation protein DivIVA
MAEPEDQEGAALAERAPAAGIEQIAADARELEYRASLLVMTARRAADEYRAAVEDSLARLRAEAEEEAEGIRAAARAEAEEIVATARADAEAMVSPARAQRQRLLETLDELREALGPRRRGAAEAAAPPEGEGAGEAAPATGGAGASVATARVRALELLLRGRSRDEILTDLREGHPDMPEEDLVAMVSDLLLPPAGEAEGT